MLTRTNYVVIANILKHAREFNPSEEGNQTVDSIMNMLIGAFSIDNPNFDIEKFRRAAGDNRND